MIFHSQYDGKVIIHSCSSSHQPALLGIYIKDYSHRNFPALSQRLHKRRVASSMPSAKVYRPVVPGMCHGCHGPMSHPAVGINTVPGLVNVYITNWKITMFVMGKLTINGPFSTAMLNYQRVYTVTWNGYVDLVVFFGIQVLRMIQDGLVWTWGTSNVDLYDHFPIKNGKLRHGKFCFNFGQIHEWGKFGYGHDKDESNNSKLKEQTIPLR